MKKLYAFIASLCLFFCTAFGRDSTTLKLEQLEKAFKFQHGPIKLANGIATVNVPPGFKYLDSVQAEKVLTEIWGNPKSSTPSLGFILPEKQSVLTGGYVFNIEYNAIGYVKDDDAADVKYDELLADMQEEALDGNTEREREGYPPITIVGWAAKPYYDANRHILHWAKEIKFGKDSLNTLNYNVRVLGRKGVLVLNAIATMDNIAAVKADIPHVLSIVNFSDGNKYTDFDSGIDEVAAWTIGGLVAGKVLAKVGFFALILKFWKLLALGFVTVGGAIRKFFTGRSKDKTPPSTDGVEKEPIAEFEELTATNKEEDKEEDKTVV